MADLLLSRGVAIEVGLCNTYGAGVLVSSSLGPRCLGILLEPHKPTAAALENVRAIEAVLDGGGVKLPRLLHGMNDTARQLIDAADAGGADTRVGFEDILTLPGGGSASSNAELVAETVCRINSRQRGRNDRASGRDRENVRGTG